MATKEPIHPHGDEALAALVREQEASQRRNAQLEAEANAARIAAVEAQNQTAESANAKSKKDK